ncbi:hypothetical protein AAF712_000319 [Marasmius tenuissimus]|uniref:Uncharacterized protein n=1 Tax=Marasmius tenuissimus TaxID=585030 RepID=A0ABR3AGN2_9AGAR
MPCAGHKQNIDATEASSQTGDFDKQEITGEICPVSSLSGITQAPCIRFSPQGAVSYSKPLTEEKQLSHSTPTRPRPFCMLSLGKRAFLKTTKWLRKSSNLNFPPVESPHSREPGKPRRKFRWTLQSPSQIALNLPPSPSPQRTSFHVFLRTRSDSNGSDSSDSPDSPISTGEPVTAESAMTVPMRRLGRSYSLRSHPRGDHALATISKRSTILLTPAPRAASVDYYSTALDSSPPFTDTFRLCPGDDDEQNLDSEERNWDGDWSTMEVRAKLRKLRKM